MRCVQLSEDFELRLTQRVLRRLEAVASHDMYPCITSVVDCMLLTIRIGRPCGVASWGWRAVRDYGALRTVNLAFNAAHVLATEATESEIQRGRVHRSLRAVVARIWLVVAAFDAGLFPDGFAGADSGFPLAAAVRKRHRNCHYLFGVGINVRRLCARLQISADAAAIVEACAALRQICNTGVSEDVLRAVPKFARYAACLRTQYERWDGRGYPDGLKRQQIPLESRIVAVVDAFQAVIAGQTAGAAPVKNTIEVLRQGAGKQWDPKIVRSLLGS